MKILSVVIVLICTSFIAFSQQSFLLSSNKTGAVNVNSVFEKTLPYGIEGIKVVPPGLRMLKAGRPLTFFGGLMIATGVVVISAANRHSYDDPNSKAVIGPILIVSGIGMTIPGIILWVRGSKKYNNYLKSKTATTSIQFQGNGLSLKYRF